jgi:hypothetical protein
MPDNLPLKIVGGNPKNAIDTTNTIISMRITGSTRINDNLSIQ